MLLAMGEVLRCSSARSTCIDRLVNGISSIIAGAGETAVGWPWWAAIIVALAVCAAIGLSGHDHRAAGPAVIHRHARRPLAWQGVMLVILGKGSSLPINDKIINDVISGNLTPPRAGR
jgi:ABC-type xylose transport system permease subunit